MKADPDAAHVPDTRVRRLFQSTKKDLHVNICK
jgi:hypothetical protein